MDLPTTPRFERRAKVRVKNERFLRIKEVMSLCGKSRASIYAAIKKGEFPKAVKLGGRSSGWVKSEIDAWIERCIRVRAEQRGASETSRGERAGSQASAAL